MKQTLTLAVLLGLIGAAAAQSVYVRPHIRSDGSYVGGHYRTAPDGRSYNNWSSAGNVNPYTGRMGSEDSFGYSPPRTYQTPAIRPIEPVRPIDPIPPIRPLY